MALEQTVKDIQGHFSNPTQRHLTILVVISSLILFVCSSMRHALLQSGAFDLGIYDQVAYLMSRGLSPVSSFLGFHHMGNHAAYSFYLVGVLYRIWTNVHWLFLIQAIALASALIPVFRLAVQAGIPENQALTLSYVYLLYPLIFNLNLYDFHPEVMALPCIFWAIWFARRDRYVPFLLCLIFILGCKAVLSLMVLALGIWLLFGERQRVYGLTAIAAGFVWFLAATQVIIPHFSGAEAAAVDRYAELGDSVLEIAWTLLTNPLILGERLFTLPNLEYVIYLFIPLAWAMVPRYLSPLVGAAPILFVNLMSDSYSQKNLTQQYSLPILPFLMVIVIASVAANKSFLKHRRAILIWAIIAFMALAKYGYFGSRYLRSLDTLSATRTAISYVNTEGSVLTTHETAPHLTHRPEIQFIREGILQDDRFKTFKYVLLNLRHPGWTNTVEVSQELLNRLQAADEFEQVFTQDDVYLFMR